MAEESIIFERMIVQENQNDSIFIRFSSETETGLTQVTPQTLVVTEGFSYGSPIVSITFVDGDGVYANLLKLSPDVVYWLTMSDGDLIKNVQRLPLRISKLECKNTVAGKSEQVAFKVSFVHYGWNEFMNTRFNRGWSNTKYSDIVSEITSSVGYDSVDTTPSRGMPECVIQPHWTNHVFLKWIQSRTVSEQYDDHFEFACKIDNSFFFKSVSDLISESAEKAENGDIPVLKLNGHVSDDKQRTIDKEQNLNTPTYFTNYNATEYYLDSVVNGAGGVNAMYYDFQTGSFLQSTVTPSNTNALQLSDWGAIKQTNETTKYKMYGGRDVETINEAISRVSSVALSTNQFSVATEASLSSHVGDMVEVIVPSPFKMVVPFSVMYSGFYLIAAITHVVSLDKTANIVTKMELARQGFDGAELEGYVKSRAGKFIGDRKEYDAMVVTSV